jgi:hypothetical protein
MPVPSAPMTTSLVQVGARNRPTVADEVVVETGLLIVAVERKDLLDAHAAEHVEDLVAHTNRIQQVAGLHGGPPEAGL